MDFMLKNCQMAKVIALKIVSDLNAKRWINNSMSLKAIRSIEDCCDCITFITVNYNSTSKVLKLISSIRSHTKNAKIIVIDNASTDNARWLLNQASDLNLICVFNRTNMGFGAANNIGVKLAETPLIVMVNPDALFDQSTNICLYFKENLDKNEVGIVAPRIFYPDGMIQPNFSLRYSNIQTFIPQLLSLGAVFRFFNEWKFITGLLGYLGRFFFGSAGQEYVNRFTCADDKQSCSWVSGACFGIRKELFNQIGGFDDRFFLYSEDEDLCRRVQMYGKKIIYAPEVRVFHEVGGTHANSGSIGTLGRADAYRIESCLIYLKKYTDSGWGRVKWSYIIVALLRLVLSFSIVMSPRRSFRLLTRLVLI